MSLDILYIIDIKKNPSQYPTLRELVVNGILEMKNLHKKSDSSFKVVDEKTALSPDKKLIK